MALDGGKSEGGSLAEGVITNQYGKNTFTKIQMPIKSSLLLLKYCFFTWKHYFAIIS